jgi:hypothetical protein
VSKTNGDQDAVRREAEQGTEPMREPGETIDPPGGAENGSKRTG